MLQNTPLIVLIILVMYFVVSEGLQLAKASRLAEVVRGEVEAEREAKRRLQEGKREQRDKLNVMHKVCL